MEGKKEVRHVARMEGMDIDRHIASFYAMETSQDNKIPWAEF
jgi:hypothetical protein